MANEDAALLISIVAILVSVGAVLFARRQALADETIAEIEAARRHAELTPDLRVAVEWHDGQPWIGVANLGPIDLEGCAWMIDTHGTGDAGLLIGSRDGEHYWPVGQLGAIKTGDVATRQCQVDLGHSIGGVQIVEWWCRTAKDEWTIRTRVELAPKEHRID
jgi:hypothetical protein